MKAISSQQLELVIRDARERWNVPAIAVGVSRGGERVLAAAGVRSLDAGGAVTVETRFRIASITKPFVASLALTLVQDGLLDLDEPPAGSRVPATVRQLLSHQGGLAHEWPTPLEELGDDDEALLRLAAGEPERLPIGPGKLFSYCNAGYWLVGATAAHATGTSFEQAMTTRVLEPLALTATSFEAHGDAQGHVQVEPGAAEHRAVEDRYPRIRRPSGGLWSSAPDLLRFGEHHLGRPGPLSAASIGEMQRPLAAGPGFDYGLGWFLADTRGRREIGHPGSAAGFQSQLLLFPGDGIVFIGLTNSSRGHAAIEDVLASLGLGVAELADASLAEERLADLAGRYRGQGFELELTEDDTGLTARMREYDPFAGRWLELPPFSARPIGEREFEIVDGEWRGERFDFPRDGFVRLSTLAQRVE